MIFTRTRSGLVESVHNVAVVILDDSGKIHFRSGDIDTRFFYRSAVKPFQAIAGLRAGLDLPMEHLAVACSSHSGFPVHLAIVERILADHGLTVNDLRCPADYPLSEEAGRIQFAAGRTSRRAIFHNCSGKHAGWLATCVVQGWDTDSYLDGSHPLQRSNSETIAELTGVNPEPIGVDGCGAPTFSGTIVGLAEAFRRLCLDDELEPIATAVERYGALVADNERSDGRVATTLGGPSKVGAQGVFAMATSGYAIAAKSADGSRDVAVAAALRAAETAGLLQESARHNLADVIEPPIYGDGKQVGSLELAAL